MARPPMAHASRSKDCSYNDGAESVSEELEDDGPESDVKIVRAPNHRLHRIKEGVGGDLRVFLIQVVRN